MMMTTTRALAPVAARSASRGVRAAVRAGPSRGFAPSLGARRSVYCKAVEAPVNPTELKPPANLHGFELVRAEVGPELSEGHDHRHGRADGAAPVVVENLEDFTLLALEIKGLAAMLRVVEDHDALADRDLISCLHEKGL